MPDQTANKLATVWAAFFTHMEGLRGTHGTGSSLIIRAVSEGEVTEDQYPVPHLNVQLIDFIVESRANENKVWKGRIKLKCRSLVPNSAGATVEIVDKIAQIDNHLDGFVRPNGANGFEDGEWSITYPTDPEQGGTVVGERVTSFRVNVARNTN